jgi:hypothetical protein
MIICLANAKYIYISARMYLKIQQVLKIVGIKKQNKFTWGKMIIRLAELFAYGLINRSIRDSLDMTSTFEEVIQEKSGAQTNIE